MPSTPLVALGMCTTGILRGVGDARRAMYVTLGAGLAAAVFDPIMIFALDLGLDGAAISTVLARVVMLAIGIHGAHTVHGLVRLPDWRRMKEAARPFFSIGLPAALTGLVAGWRDGSLNGVTLAPDVREGLSRRSRIVRFAELLRSLP